MLCCAISDSNPLFLVFFRPTPQCHNSIVTLQQHNYSINVYNLFHGQSVPTSQDVLVSKVVQIRGSNLKWNIFTLVGLVTYFSLLSDCLDQRSKNVETHLMIFNMKTIMANVLKIMMTMMKMMTLMTMIADLKYEDLSEPPIKARTAGNLSIEWLWSWWWWWWLWWSMITVPPQVRPHLCWTMSNFPVGMVGLKYLIIITCYLSSYHHDVNVITS